MKSGVKIALTKFGFAILILVLCIYASSASLLSSSETLSRGYAGQRFVMIKVPAVYIDEEGGMHGVATELLAGAGWPGNGTVYFSAEPLTQIDMQAATRVAAMIASTLAGVSMKNYDFFVRFRSESIVVGGPSASGATTVALLAILTGTEVLPNVSMTGMIEPDGTIGPVGGVPEKLEAMAKVGVKVFLIPKGQSVVKEFRKVVENKTVGGAVIITEKVVPVTVNVTELGEKLGVKVVEVGSVAEAFKYFTGKELKLPEFKREYPDWLRHVFTILGERMSRSAESNLSLAKSILKKSGAITKLLDDVSSHLSNYNTLLSEGKYYSAASEAFQAAILASYVASLAKASKGLTTEDVVSQLRSEVLRYANACEKIINSTEKLFRELSYKPVTDVRLQLAIAAYQRLVDANESLSTAYRARLYPPSVGGDALYYSIYAYWRAETAYSYLRMALNASEGIELSKNLLSKGVNTLLYFTVSVDAYLSSLGGRSYGVDITKAMKLTSEGKYIEAAAYVVTALTYDVSAMHAYYGTQEKLAPYAREGAEVLAGRVHDLGLTPILSMLYLERAETVNESLAKIRLYEEASAYSLLLINSVLTKPKPPSTTTHIKQEKVVTVTTTATETTTVTATTTMTHTVPAGHGSSVGVLETVGVNIISFLVGVLAGALISLALRRSL